MGLHRSSIGYAAAVGLTALATAAALLAHGAVAAAGLSLIFVLPVVICAAGFGWGPALAASTLGVLAFNFFLLDPRFSLEVADPANLLALLLLLVVAAIVSAVSGFGHRRAAEARRRADQALALLDLVRALSGAKDRAAIRAAAKEALTRLFGAPAEIVLETEAGEEGLDALGPADRDAVRWALAARLPTRGGAYPVDQANYDVWPTSVSGSTRAAIALVLPDEERPEDLDTLVGIVAGHLSVALARDDYARQALETQVAMAEERLKGELLAAVSHDLKTPLTTIMLSLQSLLQFQDVHDLAARTELLSLASREAERLKGMVANLLDMNRLEAGAVVVSPADVAPADLAAAAIARVETALARRKVIEEIEPGVRLRVDRGLAETALANLLENAGKFSPEGAVVRLRFETLDGDGVFSVQDEGPGFPEPVEPLFAKFARGAAGDGRPPGTGLGLAIARGFAQAQGGRVEAANRPDGRGGVARLILPVAE